VAAAADAIRQLSASHFFERDLDGLKDTPPEFRLVQTLNQDLDRVLLAESLGFGVRNELTKVLIALLKARLVQPVMSIYSAGGAR
jgi:hypothetical protein